MAVGRAGRACEHAFQQRLKSSRAAALISSRRAARAAIEQPALPRMLGRAAPRRRASRGRSPPLLLPSPLLPLPRCRTCMRHTPEAYRTVQAGADVTARDNWGRSALHWARVHGRSDII